jgi:hypothetical protein
MLALICGTMKYGTVYIKLTQHEKVVLRHVIIRIYKDKETEYLMKDNNKLILNADRDKCAN